VAVALVLVLVSIVACCTAAFRSANVDPGVVLRHD